jgi:hypothetical protein
MSPPSKVRQISYRWRGETYSEFAEVGKFIFKTFIKVSTEKINRLKILRKGSRQYSQIIKQSITEFTHCLSRGAQMMIWVRRQKLMNSASCSKNLTISLSRNTRFRQNCRKTNWRRNVWKSDEIMLGHVIY